MRCFVIISLTPHLRIGSVTHFLCFDGNLSLCRKNRDKISNPYSAATLPSPPLAMRFIRDSPDVHRGSFSFPFSRGKSIHLRRRGADKLNHYSCCHFLGGRISCTPLHTPWHLPPIICFFRFFFLRPSLFLDLMNILDYVHLKALGYPCTPF